MVEIIPFETASIVLRDPLILSWIIIAWLLPLIIYLFLGMFVKGKSPSGRISSKPMIMSPNYWYPVIIWGLIQAILIILLIFPIWLIPLS